MSTQQKMLFYLDEHAGFCMAGPYLFVIRNFLFLGNRALVNLYRSVYKWPVLKAL